MKKKIILLFSIFMALVIVYFGALQLKMSQYSKLEAPENADYIIVLGARVKGSVPSLALQARIDAASQYLKENENTIAIASGGKGHNEDISEAESIKRELVKQGIHEDRIVMEDQSTNTYENIAYAKALIPGKASTGVVVTNNFHIYRSINIARDIGLDLAGLPAETPLIAIPRSYSREYLAITKYYLIKLGVLK
ncbi:YdcF family protein [Lederbergia citrea]|uniref:YdcF family protein n=1 Tax=Lederbergia citrea TaxID=2833581 RepID=UPI001BC92702|nr:YdcF family protein [Lederbergia citrea]MBS4177807.1 YdcF family protein [Lederbergia citrea]